MTTITEDYVSFEIAKLLKEKGFDCLCHSYFRKDNPNNLVREACGANWNGTPFFTSRPTLQMACKWLREVHGLFIKMHIHNDGSYIGYIYNTNGFGLIGWDKRRVSSSYEQACEAAIKYCLKNMI